MATPAPHIEMEQPQHGATLLFVDDERNVLSALRRVFRPLGYKTLLANGGQEALQILENDAVDVIVSDMRMPEMTGAEFLQQAAERWPDTLRILLTGYSDIESAIKAINDGHIYRYINKPWDDNDLKLVIRQAVEQKQLLGEKARLEALTQQQNEELKKLNGRLEAKVRERTAKLAETAQALRHANEELKQSYASAVQVFANLLPARSGRTAEQLRHLADDACELGQRIGLNDAKLQDLRFAALLCDLGKLMLPDELLAKPYLDLHPAEQERFQKHPEEAETALMALEPLEGAAKIIRSHCERFDGKGFPDQLAGDEIPLGARVLAIVQDFDALLNGQILRDSLSVKEACSFLSNNRGQRYDPNIVNAFLKYLQSGKSAREHLDELKLTGDTLRSGMVLTRDLVNHNGILILTKGHVLTGTQIRKVRRLHEVTGRNMAVYVRPGEE